MFVRISSLLVQQIKNVHFEETSSRKLVLSSNIEHIAKRKIYYTGNAEISEWHCLRAESEVNKLIRVLRMKYLSGNL